jgi:hypothetical protein
MPVTVTKALTDLGKTQLSGEATLEGNPEKMASASPEPSY